VGKTHKAKGRTFKYNINHTTDVAVMSYKHNMMQNHKLKGEKTQQEFFIGK
jgi:hypothetical protein